MADVFTVAEGDHFVGQQAHRPSLVSGGRLAARQGQQMSLLLPVDLAFLGPLGLRTPIERLLDASLDKALAHPLDGRESHLERLLDLLIRPGWTGFAAISL